MWRVVCEIFNTDTSLSEQTDGWTNTHKQSQHETLTYILIILWSKCQEIYTGFDIYAYQSWPPCVTFTLNQAHIRVDLYVWHLPWTKLISELTSMCDIYLEPSLYQSWPLCVTFTLNQAHIRVDLYVWQLPWTKRVVQWTLYIVSICTTNYLKYQKVVQYTLVDPIGEGWTGGWTWRECKSNVSPTYW